MKEKINYRIIIHKGYALSELECNNCKHRWYPRAVMGIPLQCPKCRKSLITKCKEEGS